MIEIDFSGSVIWKTNAGGWIELQSTIDVVLNQSLTVDVDLNVSGDLDVTGNTTVGGTLGVTGLNTVDDLNVGGDLDVTGNTTVGGTLGVTGLNTVDDLDVGGDLDVVGATTVDDLAVSGKVVTSGSETITGITVVSVNTAISIVNDNGMDPMTTTLADGVEGQDKFIIIQSYNYGVNITPASFHNGTTLQFRADGECAHLKFISGAWAYMGGDCTIV